MPRSKRSVAPRQESGACKRETGPAENDDEQTDVVTVRVEDPWFTTFMKGVNLAFPDELYSLQNLPLVCLPVPAFSIRYLLGQEGWPLGVFSQIVGGPASCKSALLYEILSWHMRFANRGWGTLIETEGKLSPDLPGSIFGYNHPRFQIEQVSTLEDWFRILDILIERSSKYMDGDALTKGVGRKFPIGFGVDSIMGALPRKVLEQILRDGSPTKHVSQAPDLLDEYLKSLREKIKQMPFSLIGVNHLKSKSGSERNIAAGWATRAHSALEIETTRLTSPQPGKGIYRTDDDLRGIRLRIATFKNTTATPASLEVEMLWFLDGSTCRQRTFFDWHAASIELLIDLTKGNGARAKSLRELINLKANPDTRLVTCKELDLSKKTRYRDAGRHLEHKLRSDKKFARDLYARVGIHRRVLFKKGVDYRHQCQQAIKRALDAERRAIRVL